VTGIVAACSQASGRQTEQSQVCPRLPEASENGAELRLVACLLDDDVVPGNSVKVFVGLANDGEEPILTRARLDLGAYLLIRVEAEMGRQVETFVGEPGHFPEEVTDILLPRGGLVGRVFDLTCDPGGYRSADVRCFSEASFDEPGTYTISLSYDVSCGVAGCPHEHPWVGRLEAPPLVLSVLPGS
ncbi:MAG: hypothetical protein MJB57_05090, partial [Gemmatimonadetes bacterium]|nr:hypothetical protein [Gemmatimonadota bacterium]